MVKKNVLCEFKLSELIILVSIGTMALAFFDLLVKVHEAECEKLTVFQSMSNVD